MKRQQIQKKIARTAKVLATNIETGNFKAPIRVSSMAVSKGQPVTTLGYILTQAGILTPRANVPNGTNGLAAVLGVDPFVLPEQARLAAAEIENLEFRGRDSYAIRRALPKRLNALAAALSGTKIRKPYERSGLYTAQARAAGTFGKAPAGTTTYNALPQTL